jgi:hypothetical protein
MPDGAPKQFTTPEQEIAFLRAQIAERERTLMERTPHIDQADVETVGRQEIKAYTSFTPKMILDKDYQMDDEQLRQSVDVISLSHHPAEDILQLAFDKGIKNALTVLESFSDPFVVDEVHRRLIEEIRGGAKLADFKEGMPAWNVLHMTLYQVTLPGQKNSDNPTGQTAELVGMMEQLFMGLRTIGSVKEGNHFAIEVAVADKSDDIVFYVAVPNEYVSLFEKQTLALFHTAILTIQPHDYNVFVEHGVTEVVELSLQKHPIYSLRTHDQFTSDPLSVILNAFSKIEREGGGAAIQFLIRHPKDERIRNNYKSIIKEVERGVKPREAIARSTVVGEFRGLVGDIFTTAKKEATNDSKEISKEIDSVALEHFRTKLKTDIFETNIRIVVSAGDAARVDQIMTEIKSTFNQFDNHDGNRISFTNLTKSSLARGRKAFAFREFSSKALLPLSTTELATLIHFPGSGVTSATQFKQSYAKSAPAPTEMPTAGTYLGSNDHRGVKKEIFITEKDRMRHFYIIGQTGTGKSKFLTNLIAQDIHSGAGVCFIDPHGTDLDEVLGIIPPERANDVIYFDPSRMDQVVGLNMLDYDYDKPEQKTFVVNELFSIFQKLYTAESMGPMFEQYFRNATMLVMEDPESGNTLMDISRVMADARYRRYKLERAKNPVVVQFWQEIATKAGGEASLENIVPYIVSKFDVFTANDYMRPIIGQQRSAFNFRQVMDERKILLVNLSKGRLGEINANLIGMIFVGKILMAALSRVDDPTGNFAPFFLHIDEFQNISTNSIASILSEARKYKLGLTVAHQFIAQLDPVIKDAVFGNVGSMAAFRVGPEDGQFLESQFGPTFVASDLMNIPNFNAYMRVLANGIPTIPFSVVAPRPIEPDPERVLQLKEMSFARYGRPRHEIEAEIAQRYQKPTPPISAPPVFPQ